jgi:hypothetical protein
MHPQAETLLKKISYIEADMELHKQILVTIPPGQKDALEQVMQTIADKKKEIQDLRREIRQLDPEAYDRIIAIEKGTETFKSMAKNKQFDRVDTPDESGTCKLTLIDGTEMDCLVAAREETGDWMVLTLEGEIKQLSHVLVK